MTDAVHRAGAADGLAAVSLSRALRVGVLVGWTTAAASLRDPGHRVIGMMWALLTVVAGWFGWILAGPQTAVLGAVVGFVGYFAVIMLLSVIIEPVLFARAARVWLIDERGRRGCAKAVETSDGAWRLRSVAAWPFGRGIGSELTEAVTADADRCQRTLQLTAENRRVGSLYQRFGFTYPRSGRHEMRRDPIQAEARQTTAKS
ncbi:MAG TPA: hypothetical protein VIU11_22990 [Nakamurella sp.]